MSAKSDGTLSVKEAYEFWADVYGPRTIMAFYIWRIRHKIPTAPGSTPNRPRYWPNDILEACGVTSKTIGVEELQRRAHETADYAARGLKWPPT